MDQKSEQNDKLEDDSKTNVGKKTCHCPPSNLIGGQAKTELREKKKVKRLTKFDCKTVDVTPFFIYLLTLHLNQSQTQGTLIDNQKNCCQTSTLLLKKIIEKLAYSVQQAPCGKCNNKNCRKGTDKCCGCGTTKKARITHEKCFQEFDQKYGDFHSKLSAFLDTVGSESKDKNEDKEDGGSEHKGSKGGKGGKGSKEGKHNDPDSTNPTISQSDNVEQGKEHHLEQPHCICGGNLYSFKDFAPDISIGTKSNAIECRSELQEKHANCFCSNHSQNKHSRFKGQPRTLGKVCSSSSDRPHYTTQQNSWKQQHTSQLKICNSRSQQEVSEMRKNYCNCSSNEQLKKIIDAIIKECASEGVLKDKLMNCLTEKLNPGKDPLMLPNKDMNDNHLMPPHSGKKCLRAESVEAIVHKEVEKQLNENAKFANETKQNKPETATDPKPCKYEESDHPPTIFQKCLKCGCSTKRVPERKKSPNPQNAPKGTSDVYYFLNQETTLPKVNDKLDEKLLKSSLCKSDTLQSSECQRPVSMCNYSPNPKCSESPEKMKMFTQNGFLSCSCAPKSNFSQMLEQESKDEYNKCIVTDQTNKTSLLASYDDLAFKAKQLEYQQQELIQQQKALLEQKLQQQKQQEQIQQQLLELQQQQLQQQLIHQQLQQMQKQQIYSQQMRERQMGQQKIQEHFPHNLLRQQYQTQPQHMQQLQPIKECWEPSPDKQQLGYDINANNDQRQSNNTSNSGKGRFDFELPKQVIDHGENSEQALSQNDPCYAVTKTGKLNRSDSIELETEYNLETKQDDNCQNDEFSKNDQSIDVKPDFMQEQIQSKPKSKQGFFSMFSTQPARKECVEVKITACPPMSNQEAQSSKNLRPKKLLNDEECYRKTETSRRISFENSPRNSCESSLYSRYFGFFKQKFEGKGENCEKSETSSKSGNSEYSAKNENCEQLDNRENCEQFKKRENCEQLFEKRENCEQLKKRENCEQLKKRENCEQLFEKRENCEQLKKRENCEQLKKRENCEQLFEKRENCEQFKKRENCQQLFEKRENCEQLKKREYCEQLKQRENCEQLKQREYWEQLKQRENCEQLKQREYCEQLKLRENCEQLKKREYCEQLKKREYCEQLTQRENCEQLKKREYCEQLKQRENCERLVRGLKRVQNNNCENTGLQISKIKVHCNNRVDRNNMLNQKPEFHPEQQPQVCSKDIETFEKCPPSHEQPPIYYSIQNKGWSRANPPKWKAIDDVIARKSITSESESSACNGNRLRQHRPSSCDPVESYSYQRNNISEDFTDSNYNNCNVNSTNMNSEGHKASSISDISDTFLRAKFRERNLSNSPQYSRRRMYMTSRQWAMQPSRKIRDKRVNPVLIELSNKNLQQHEKVDPNSPSTFTPNQGKEEILFQRTLSTITEVDNENIGPSLSEQPKRAVEPLTEEIDTRSDCEADPFRKRNMFKGFFSKMKLDWPKKKNTLKSTEHKEN